MWDVTSEEVAGARTFKLSGATYDSFMGRYSKSLAAPFADFAGVVQGQSALDVGCGPGALTGVLADRLGADQVVALDPSPMFVQECAERHPGVAVHLGRSEELPFDDDRFDVALAQLVFHFVSDPSAAAAAMRRVVRPGGTIAACVWDFSAGMQMLRHFWDATLDVDPGAPDEAGTLRFGGPGEISELFTQAGLDDVRETELTVSSTYESFDELWSGFLAGVGPAGAYCVSLPEDRRSIVRQSMFARLGEPAGTFTLDATARASRGRVPA